MTKIEADMSRRKLIKFWQRCMMANASAMMRGCCCTSTPTCWIWRKRPTRGGSRLSPVILVTYLIDRNINYTNVCVTDCQFCNFYALPGDDKKGYVNSKLILGKKIEEALALGATRILMQGGHNPDLPFEYYTDLVGWIHKTFPTIEINAFSPSEIQYMSEMGGKTWRETLTELKAVGLMGLPGGGGEILDDEIRQRVTPKKIMTDDWFGVMKIAHELGLITTDHNGDRFPRGTAQPDEPSATAAR